MICTCERGNDDFYQNTLVASLIINPGALSPPRMSELVVAPRATTTALQYSSLKYCVAAFKDKAIAAKVVCEFEVFPTKPQTQNCIFGAQILFVIFSLPCKRSENSRNAMKIQPFVPYRANVNKEKGFENCSQSPNGRSDTTRTCDPRIPNAVRYQLRYTPKCVKNSIFAVFP